MNQEAFLLHKVDFFVFCVSGNSLPGKIAPITSGEIIADTISGIIQERSEADVKA